MNDDATDPIEAAQRDLGRALRELRKRAGLTQKELGARAGADATYLSQVETGQRDIRWSTVTRLLRALDASPADLAAEVERQAQRSVDAATDDPH
jgi:transcriptional regulator with XRE-family HTH domain